MPNRIIKESICTSSNLDGLTAQEEVFFYRLIVQCDDFGRMDGRPAILRAKCFPLRTDKIREPEIVKWLSSLIQHELVYLYEVDSRLYLQVSTWDRHQQKRAQHSKYPDPDSGCIVPDITGYQLISTDIKCPRESRIENRENEKRETVIRRFGEFWQLYPKKVKRAEAEKAFVKASPDDDLFMTIIKAVKCQSESEGWRKEGGKYIPNAASWLNGKRWEDEVSGGSNGHRRNPITHRCPEHYTEPDSLFAPSDGSNP